MKVINENISLEKSLSGLLKKYNVESRTDFQLTHKDYSEGLLLIAGRQMIDSTNLENKIPLLIHRLKRKFIELKKIVEEGTIENVSMFRFSCMGAKDIWDLKSLLYQELDLCEFIGGGKINSFNAVFSENKAGNVILRLDNNILCSVEVSAQMPVGSYLTDRHEIIAQRGVASDLVVDTMIPQSSIYGYVESGRFEYRDVDMELFGLDELQTDHVRAAFHVLNDPKVAEQWKLQHNRLVKIINKVFESDKERKKVILNEQ